MRGRDLRMNGLPRVFQAREGRLQDFRVGGTGLTRTGTDFPKTKK
jgi:hypothetical protein